MKKRSTRKGRGNYTVGDCKPPVEHQFKPKQSGNPKGRPKGSKNLKTIIKAAARKKVSVGQGTKRRKLLITEVAIHHLQQFVLKGDRKGILDYLDIISRYEDRDDLNLDQDLSRDDAKLVAVYLDRRQKAAKKKETRSDE